MKQKKYDKTTSINMIKLLIGNMVLGLAYSQWMVPHKIINGGVTSLSLILSKLTSINIVVLTNCITFFLLGICLIFLGKDTLLKSLVGSLTYLFFFSFFSRALFLATGFYIVDFSLACLFIAIGYYLCISAGSSTVGLDVIALIIHKKKKEWQIATIIRNLNFLVLIGGFFTYGWTSVVMGILFSFIYSWLLGKFITLNEKGALI